MHRMKKSRSALLTGIVLAVAVGLLAWGIASKGGAGRALSWIGTTLRPAQTFIVNMTGRVQAYFEDRAFAREANKTIRDLSGRVAQLQMDNDRLKEQLRDVQNQVSLQEFEAKYPGYLTLDAKVIGNKSSSWFEVFQIDKGGDDGLKVGMPVTTEKGLVGQLIEVYPSYSVVRSIIDAQSKLSAIVESSRDLGIVEGVRSLTGSEEQLRMVNLEFDVEVQPGARILSSGLERIFPKGILIGEAVSIAQGSIAQRHVSIRPAVDFRRLERVLIIVGESEEETGIEESMEEGA